MNTEPVHVGFDNIVVMNKVIAILSPKQQPIKRLMQEATYGTRGAVAGGLGMGAAMGDISWAVAGIAGTIGGTAGLAKFMTSNFGRKWLIEGFNIPMENRSSGAM